MALPSRTRSLHNCRALIAPGLSICQWRGCVELTSERNSPPPLHIKGNQVKTVHSPCPNGNNMPWVSCLPSPLVSRVSCLAVALNSVQLVGRCSTPAALKRLGR